MRKTDWFMISNWLISDDKKNKFNFTFMYIGQNEKGLLSESNHETRDLEMDDLTTISWVVMVAIFVGTLNRVLNLIWTWNYCCKLEIVCADGSPFLVTKGFDALREDHWRRTFNFFLMGTYNTETGTLYLQPCYNLQIFSFLKKSVASPILSCSVHTHPPGGRIFRVWEIWKRRRRLTENFNVECGNHSSMPLVKLFVINKFARISKDKTGKVYAKFSTLLRK